MPRNREGLPPGEKIVGISIPDDEVINWMETLRRLGFSQEEIDGIMVRMNENFAEQKIGPIVRQMVDHVLRIYDEQGKPLTELQRQELYGRVLKDFRRRFGESILRTTAEALGKIPIPK